VMWKDNENENLWLMAYGRAVWRLRDTNDSCSMNFVLCSVRSVRSELMGIVEIRPGPRFCLPI
jgi:hypothetical protein